MQHNPLLGDGVAELRTSLQATKSIRTRYLALHRVFGERNFVLAMCEALVGDKHCAIYDLYRLSDGHIAEHWDVIEEMMPREQRKNHNGKL